ncbi:MAG: hypothetical protein HWD59_05465 [Coxiellaceae bacterium]|nr:MAG: hypothetical protein HWD59_05465 [Coxiellaceae bacterium]
MAYHPQTLLQQFIKLMLRFTLLFSVMLVLVACASQQQVSYQQRQYLLGKENFATGNYEVAFYQLLPAAKRVMRERSMQLVICIFMVKV